MIKTSELRNSVVPATALSDHCLFLIPTPADSEIYAFFQRLAREWGSRLRREQLLLEGSIPLEPQLGSPFLSPAIRRIVTADRSLIHDLVIDIGGLTIRFCRSGGHTPYRESYFDEVVLEVWGDFDLTRDELQAITHDIRISLKVAAATGTSLFAGDVSDISDG